MASFKVGEAPWETRTANSARPTDLPSPIPKGAEQAVAAPVMPEGSFAAGSAPWETTSATSSVAEPSEDQFAPDQGFIEANLTPSGIGDQLSNFVTRTRAGLAANDTEKLGFLQKKFGPENAVIKNDNIYFRKSKDEKFKRLDQPTLEIIGDLIPDFSREIITESAMFPGEAVGALAGTAIGALATAPAAGVGAIPGFAAGAVAGRVASVVPANAFADKVASLAGVPQDENRKGGVENAIQMAGEVVLPMVGRGVIRMLPGSSAYKAAKEAGKKEIVALSEQSQVVAKNIQDLTELGREARINGEMVGVPGANVSLMGHHLNPDNPKLLNFAQIAATNPKFINAENKLAQDWGSSLENTFVEIAKRNNKGPVDPNKLSMSITNAVNDLQKAEGEAIGGYVAKATAELKNNRLPLNKATVDEVKSLLTEFGFKPRLVEKQVLRRPMSPQAAAGMPQLYPGKVASSQMSTAWRPPANLQEHVGKMGLMSTGDVRAVTNNLMELSKVLDKGANITDLNRLRNSLGSTGDALYGKPAGQRLSALSGELRQTYRDAVSAGLSDEVERKGFNAAMDDFGMIKQNIATLKSGLNENSSAKAIVNTFFTGKENLDKIKAIQKLSPESFGNLKEVWINELLAKHASTTSKTGFNSSAFKKELDVKYGPQFVKQVLDDGPGPNSETISKILSVTERIEMMSKKTPVDKMSESQKKGIMDAGIGLLGGIKFKAVNGITALLQGRGGEENAMMAIMTRDGIDKYIASYPGKIDKKTVMQNLNDMLAESKFIKAVEADVTKRATKRAVISGAQEPNKR